MPSRRAAIAQDPARRLRDTFFRHEIDPEQLLQAFEDLPGVLYFIKDARSRTMAISRASALRMGFQSEEELVGRTVGDYLPVHLAEKYLADDQWVLRHGQPLRNVVEMWFNERGIPDWIITNKYPLRDARGKVVGLIGTVQTLETRRRLLAHLGPVGRAADFIRDHLSEPMLLAEIARHARLSERQLQRLFRRAFGRTIQQFIIQSRIHGAIHELTRSEKTIAHIATLFGFGDQSAFSNAFRKITGHPPGAYRRRYLAGLTPR